MKKQLYEHSRVGRPRKYEPLELWEESCKYFRWCDANPWIKYEAIKSGPNVGTLVEIPTAIPYTLEGLSVFLGLDVAYFRQNKENTDIQLSTVIKEIYKIIESQQFVGASVGAFNPNIIARKLGLADKQSISTPEGEEIRINTVNEHRVIFENYDESNV